MVSADRQTIMEANRSLRSIKNELESLLEKGVIDESVYDNIHAALPEESPLSGPLRTATGSSAPAARNTANQSPAPAAARNSPPTNELNNLNIGQSHSPAPPSYNDTPPPGLPSRNAKPVIAHARALYRYAATDARDLTLEKDDKIAVHEYMNNDWWMGQNTRTGQEGIFPRSYVFIESNEQAKGAPMGYPQQPQYGYPPGPPAQQNPYNASAPPMAIAQESQPASGEPSKAGQYGKKFGKKLGNAAVFGAGATIGSNIVNSIF